MVTWAVLPNALTVTRLLLVGPILWCLAQGWAVAALLLFVLAGVSDALDGYLARRLNARTALGAVLDPLADKALVSGVFVALAVLGDLPWWLVVLVVGRDLALVAGVGVVRWAGGAFAPRPTRMSRLNTVAQMTLLAASLAVPVLAPTVLAPVVTALVPAVAVTTLVSGLDYGRAALAHLRHARRPPTDGDTDA